MRPFNSCSLLPFLTCLILLCACGGEGQPREGAGINVLLITIDTIRADRLGCYGYVKGETPALDALAKRGVLFEQAFTAVPSTLPSHTSILTGLDPPEHGVRENDGFKLRDDVTTLAEVFKKKGYRTGAFIGAFVLDSLFNLDQGFDVYDDDLGSPTQGNDHGVEQERRGDKVVDSALAWLGTESTAPFFCWVHLFDPHAPYVPPPPFSERFSGDPYDGEIAFADSQVGRLTSWLQGRDLTGRTLVVVTGDHGEGLGDHNELRHSMFVYGSTLHVPLIFSLPGKLPEGRRIGTPVSLIDIYPSVTDLLEAGTSSQVSGRSLVAAMNGQDLEERDIYSESNYPFDYYGWSPLRALTTPRWKYIRAPVPELYDRTSDPGEENNVAAGNADLVKKLDAKLVAMEQAMVPQSAERAGLTAEQRERLQSLGYVAGGTRSLTDVDVSSLVDPKEMTDALNRSIEVHDMLAEGKVTEAIATMRTLVEQNPDNAQFQSVLAGALNRSGDFAGAARHYEAALKIDEKSGLKSNIGTSFAQANLGQVLTRLKRDEEAIEHFEKAVAINPENAMVYNNMGAALAREKRYLESALSLRRALEIDPENSSVRNNLTRVLQLVGGSPSRYTDGYDLLRSGRDFETVDPPIRDILARVLAACPDESLRDPSRALRLAREVCDATQYGNPIFIDTLAIAYSNMDQFAKAIALSSQALDIAVRSNNVKLAAAIRKRIKLYESHKRFQEFS